VHGLGPAGLADEQAQKKRRLSRGLDPSLTRQTPIITIFALTTLDMPYFRNFTYYIDKRRWKYCFLLEGIVSR
jgi:hypothetical protein